MTRLLQAHAQFWDILQNGDAVEGSGQEPWPAQGACWTLSSELCCWGKLQRC